MEFIPIRRSCAQGALVTGLLAMLASTSGGQQRILFPTQVSQPADIGPPAISGGTAVPGAPGWDAYADPGLSGPPAIYSPPGSTPYTAVPGAYPPGVVQPGPYPPYQPGAVQPGAVPGPYAAPPYGADPYYNPAPTQPGYLYPNGAPTYTGPGSPMENPLEMINGWSRFFQEIRLQETYMYDSGNLRLSINDIETSATFAFPLGWNKAPLLVTPGYGLHLFSGPPGHGPGSADLPAQTYDAYIDGAWAPQFSPWLGAELGARVGVFTDYHTFNTRHSIREMGRALAVVNYSPTVHFKLGVVYLDRNYVKMLPAGGVFWSPDPDTRIELFFPRPKYTHRITTTGTYQIWLYSTAEYGGGAWTIRRADGVSDDFDYNDIKMSTGLEFIPETSTAAVRGYLEVGTALDRELRYRSNNPREVDLSNAFMVRAGVSY